MTSDKLKKIEFSKYLIILKSNHIESYNLFMKQKLNHLYKLCNHS